LTTMNLKKLKPWVNHYKDFQDVPAVVRQYGLGPCGRVTVKYFASRDAKFYEWLERIKANRSGPACYRIRQLLILVQRPPRICRAIGILTKRTAVHSTRRGFFIIYPHVPTFVDASKDCSRIKNGWHPRAAQRAQSQTTNRKD
jgi:hypothetical protein